MTNPVFIPAAQVQKGVDYRGYVATPEGMVRRDRATFWKDKDGLRLKKTPAVRDPSADPAPLKRRTTEQQAESLARRIYVHATANGGLPESLFRELQAVSWELGEPVTFEQAKELANHCLNRNRLMVKDEHQKHVTNPSPYVLDRPSTPEPEKAHPGRLIFTPQSRSSAGTTSGVTRGGKK